MPMDVMFRVDASLQIGAGHVMRCLALAGELAGRGHRVGFACRRGEGDMAGLIAGRGHAVVVLPATTTPHRSDDYASWLGAQWQDDADQCRSAMPGSVDWLVVDHYGIDENWERRMRAVARRIMVIDDLANRPHDCDLLLDQTHGRTGRDYAGLTGSRADVLCGTRFALLRPEFAAQRADAIARRQASAATRILVSMGGVDRDNITSAVLAGLAAARLPAGCRITVVLGKDAPWLRAIEVQAKAMPVPTVFLHGVTDMASLVADSDLAIGAAGSSVWERCCLGLPTIMVPVAANQSYAASRIADSGSAVLLSPGPGFERRLSEMVSQMLADTARLHAMGRSAAALVDGEGCRRVADQLDRNK